MTQSTEKEYKKIKVSIVIPVYNVEKYLERCLLSIVNQTYSNLEIILVDDGSPDNCPSMCNEWAQKDNRIKVIHKQNEGLGYARNTGIEHATGDYICFFDSDDYIALDTIEKCVHIAKQEGTDIVSFGYNNVNNKQEIYKTTIPCPSKYVYEGKEIHEYFLPNLIAPDIISGEITNLWMSACGSFCRAKVIMDSGWRFVSERTIISEDVYSLLRLYYNVKKVAVIPKAFYYYCDNAKSLTHTYRKDRYIKIKGFYDACIKECNNLEYSFTVKNRFLYPYISFTLAALKMIVNSDDNIKVKKENVDAIIHDSHLREVILNSNIKSEAFTRKLFMNLIKYKQYKLCRYLIFLKK